MCGFHCCVQCQQVGLEGDLVDDVGDIGNFLAGGADFRHCADGQVDRFPTFFRLFAGLRGELAGLHGIGSVVAYRTVDFLHARCRGFQAGSLRLGAGAQVHIAAGNFLCILRNVV